MHGGELRTELSAAHRGARVRIVRRIDLGDTVLHRYHPASKTLEISTHLSAGQRAFKMAAELAYLEVGDLIDTLVADGKFTSDGPDGWPAWDSPTISPRPRCCRTGSSTTSARTSATTSSGCRRSTR